MSALTFHSPAKINLLLAITGQRPDGFHDLVSVVAPLEWGDTLTVEPASEFSVVCNDPAVPTDSTNLILRAAEVFRRTTGFSGGARYLLDKRIPMGAGLGGGSSNAAIALKALRALSGLELNDTQLAELAAEVGSDCPLFLQNGPVVMRGRGERVEVLPERGSRRITGRRILIFKPAFGIATPWAYRQLAAQAPSGYLPAELIERRLASWLNSDKPIEELLLNTMEGPAFAKFPALPAMLERLSGTFGLNARMSGSGSACFALYGDESPIDAIIHTIRESWGESAVVVKTRLK